MQQMKAALKLTTAHGLPRLVTKKPLYVKAPWLALFIAALVLCLKGTADFVKKLQSRQVTTTLEANALEFKFPDIYACFENPISSSYAATMSNATVAELEAQLNLATVILRSHLRAGNASVSGEEVDLLAQDYSFALLHSLQYRLLVDSMAHRLEQLLVTSDTTYISSNGLPAYEAVDAASFYHPVYLRCVRWALNSTIKTRLTKSGTSGGLVVTLLTDANYSDSAHRGPPQLSKVFAGGSVISVSDWSLSRLDYDDPDRKAGVRIFLCPPGEYPTAFVTSFSLGPGRYHTVEMSMTEQVYNPASFDNCLSDPGPVQFLNPYTQEPDDHAYSYSYCYFYEYHKQYQDILNLSGDASPLPWPLRGRKFLFNLTGPGGNFLPLTKDIAANETLDFRALSRIVSNTQQACLAKSPCTTQLYDVTISNTDWPTFSSVRPFVSATVYQAKERAGNSSVPALDLLLDFDNAAAANFANANLLKVNFKIRGPSCNRVTFSIDYGVANLISDLGGIMGIYLGMSLLTICELFEFLYDMAMAVRERHRGRLARDCELPAVSSDKSSRDGKRAGDANGSDAPAKVRRGRGRVKPTGLDSGHPAAEFTV